jgi:hypothetical protein
MGRTSYPVYASPSWPEPGPEALQILCSRCVGLLSWIDRLRRFFIKDKEGYEQQNLSTLVQEVQAIGATEVQSRKIKIDPDVPPNVMVLGDLIWGSKIMAQA